MKINDSLSLRTAGIYAHAGDPGALLPVVYGDFLSDQAISSETTAGGMLPAVLIDVTTWTYLLNDGPSSGEAPDVYVEDVLQNPIVYSYNPGIDYEGQGVVTILTFNTDPGGRAISWNGKGKVTSSGTLITNPIDGIKDMFINHGNWVEDDFDPATVNEARRSMAAQQLTFHWCFAENKTYKESLTEILPHYFGDMLLTVDGRLAILLDAIVNVNPGLLVAQLDALVHVDGEAPEAAIEWDLDRRNFINELTVFYQFSWARNVYTQQDVARHEGSIRLYGTTMPREVRLPGLRTLPHFSLWTSLALARYALLPAVVRVPVRTLRYLALMPGTYTALAWRWGPSTTGTGWLNRELKVLNTGLDFTGQRSVLECFDTGLEFLQPTYAVLFDDTAQLWYLSVTDQGLVQFSRLNPGQDRVNAEVWSWIRLISPTDVIWYVAPNETGTALGSFVLGSTALSDVTWTITDTLPAGDGRLEPLILVSRIGQRWQLVITDDDPPIVLFVLEGQPAPFTVGSGLTEVLDRFVLDVNVLA